MIVFVFQETGKVLFPQDFKYSLNYGGKKIIFDKEEIAGIKSFGTAGKRKCN